MYGFGHCWSLQVQLLSIAQSSLISFLLKSLHLIDLARKFPIIFAVAVGKRFWDLLNLVLTFSLKVKLSLSAAEFVLFLRRLFHFLHSF